jgi:hypothetical protein
MQAGGENVVCFMIKAASTMSYMEVQGLAGVQPFRNIFQEVMNEPCQLEFCTKYATN